MDLREDADYGGLSEVTSESARVAMGKAQTIPHIVKKAVPEFA